MPVSTEARLGLTPSGSFRQVELLLGWASAGGYEWSVNVPGPNGISPLHLSALLPDDGAIAHLLTGEHRRAPLPVCSVAEKATWSWSSKAAGCSAQETHDDMDFDSAALQHSTICRAYVLSG